MEGQKQLISEDTASERSGIEAPYLIQQDIKADEEGHMETNTTMNKTEVVESQKDVEGKETSSAEEEKCEQTQADDIQIELKGNKIEEGRSSNADGDKETNNIDEENQVNKLLDERNIVVDDDGNSTNIPTTSKHNESSSEKTDSEKSQNTTRDKLNHENEEKIHKNKESNENHYVEVILDDGNNNVENTENSKKKESIRRTRFSSEITIQPKAYFQAGVDAVVMMPPCSSSDEVFKNETAHSVDSTSSSAVVNTKPSDSPLPRTFLPLTLMTCLFCPMIGLFAVYKSYSVKQLIKKGNIRKANEASEHARQLGVLTLCIGFFFVLAIITIAVLVSTLT